MTHPIDEMIAKIEADPDAGSALMAGINQELLEVLCPLLERFDVGDQMMALAACFAMACASIEGETVDIEKEHGILVGFEDRLRLHVAEIRAVYKEAYAFRSHPDAPQTGGRKM